MKKFKTRRNKNQIKIIIVIILFLVIFIIISFYKNTNSYKNLTNILLNSFDENTDKIKLSFLTSNLDNLFNDYSFYQRDEIYQKNKSTIYLYNTHDTEKYKDNKSIIEATTFLKNNLTKLGIQAIQEERRTSELVTTDLSYYDISRTFIKDVIINNNIAYFIDIHRDSANNTTIKIKDKNYAKVMFVLGLENKNYLKNKSLLLKMNDYLNKNYPGLSRGIYEKKGSNVDGVYNQDLSSNVILIEIGGIDNNLEEVNNSTEILSLMLYYMLGD